MMKMENVFIILGVITVAIGWYVLLFMEKLITVEGGIFSYELLYTYQTEGVVIILIGIIFGLISCICIVNRISKENRA